MLAGSVTRLRLSADDMSLYAASADGAIFVFDIRDRDPLRAITKRSVWSRRTPMIARACHLAMH